MRQINRCLNKQLLDMCQRTMLLDDLNSKLKMYLQPSLHKHCAIGSFNKGCLVITTDNAAWATELRYEIPALRDRLRKDAGLYQLLSIQIKVVEERVHQAKPGKVVKTHQLSSTARHTILTAGEECDYQPLKAALFKLAEKT